MKQIFMNTQEYVEIIDMVAKKISIISNNPEYSDNDKNDIGNYVIIGEYDIVTEKMLGMKYIYCPTITGFKLGNCYNYKMCREFEDI